jgi:hypothetical protein
MTRIPFPLSLAIYITHCTLEYQINESVEISRGCLRSGLGIYKYSDRKKQVVHIIQRNLLQNFVSKSRLHHSLEPGTFTNGWACKLGRYVDVLSPLLPAASKSIMDNVTCSVYDLNNI